MMEAVQRQNADLQQRLVSAEQSLLQARLTGAAGDGATQSREDNFSMRVGKEMMPGDYDGKCRAEFRNWCFKMEAYLVDQTYDCSVDIMEWAADQTQTIKEEDYEKEATARTTWIGKSGRDNMKFARYLYNILTTSWVSTTRS